MPPKPPDRRSAPTAARDAYRTGKAPSVPPDGPWSRTELRAYVRDRAWGLCEWPRCGDPGDEMAHVYGIGMGGRPSADRPENVAWLCRRHHSMLDGRSRLQWGAAAGLISSLPTAPGGGCAWFCPDPAVDVFAMRSLCARHLEVATGENVPTRRTELALALAEVVRRANESMGRRPS